MDMEHWFSTIQSLPKSSSPRGWHETRLETTLTYQPIPDIQLSVLSGWALERGPDEALDTKPWEFQKFIVGGALRGHRSIGSSTKSTKDSTFFYGTERLEVGLLQSEAILGLAWGPGASRAASSAAQNTSLKIPTPCNLALISGCGGRLKDCFTDYR